MTVYVDLLLIYNLLVHFCLLSSTAALSSVRMKKWRCLLGCILGSGYSFAIFLSLDAWEFMLMKAVMAVSLILTAFGFGVLRVFIKRLLLFLAVNLVYAGAMYAVAFTLAPKGMVYRSGVAYFGFDVTSYALGLLAAYGLLRLGVFLFSRGGSKAASMEVVIRCGERTVKGAGLCDSGNRMVDLFSGRPVMVVSPQLAKKLLPDQVLPFFLYGEPCGSIAHFGHGARLIPLETVGGRHMLAAFLPDEIRLLGNGEQASPDWMVAVSKTPLAQGTQMILPAAAFDFVKARE